MRFLTVFTLTAILLLFLMAYNVKAQTVVRDKSGNYVAVKDTAKTDELLALTFTDVKGKVWPVYMTKKGRVYALKTSKAGNVYRVYLDFHKELSNMNMKGN